MSGLPQLAPGRYWYAEVSVFSDGPRVMIRAVDLVNDDGQKYHVRIAGVLPGEADTVNPVWGIDKPLLHLYQTREQAVDGLLGLWQHRRRNLLKLVKEASAVIPLIQAERAKHKQEGRRA